MSCFNKEQYKNVKRFAEKEKVHVRTAETIGAEYSGITVAFRPCIQSKDGRMITVSVSYCAVEDEYKKKHGKYQALLKFFGGETIQLPLAKQYRRVGPEQMGAELIDLFWI